MVSVTIFAVVMMIGVGAILAVVNGNRKNQTMQIAINNLNYAIENITRQMKTGTNFTDIDINIANPNCSEPMGFTNVEGDYVIISRDVIPNTGGVYGLYQDIEDGFSGFITAPEINIERLCFGTIGTQTGDFLQPAIIMLIEGKTIDPKQEINTSFRIHTSVTQRSVQY